MAGLLQMVGCFIEYNPSVVVPIIVNYLQIESVLIVLVTVCNWILRFVATLINSVMVFVSFLIPGSLLYLLYLVYPRVFLERQLGCY